LKTTSRSVTEASPFARTPLAISNSHFIGFNTTNILKISSTNSTFLLLM
jgi:hypothetical protein